MLSFHIDPPSKLNDLSLSESFLFCSFSASPLSRCRAPTMLSATSKVGRGKRRWRIHHTEYALLGKTQRENKLVPQTPLGENQCCIPQSHAWEHPMRQSEQGGAASDAYWQTILYETKLEGKSITKEALIGAIWKSFGKTALFTTISLQKKVTMRSAMEHNCPDVQFILGRHYLHLCVSKQQQETSCSEMTTSSRSKRTNGQ